MKTLRLITLSLIAIYSSNIFAIFSVGNLDEILNNPKISRMDNEAETVHKTNLKEIIKRAIKNGAPKQIGVLNLEKLISDIDTVKLYSNKTETPLLGSQFRSGSIYLTNLRIVIAYENLYILANNSSPFIQQGMMTMLLHEFLGALGFFDENYELSTYIYLKSFGDYISESITESIEISIQQRMATHSLREHNPQYTLDILNEISVSDFPSRLNIKPEYLHIAAGSTGVGGGGDPGSAALKLLIYNFLSRFGESLLRINNIPVEYLPVIINKVIHARIEPIPQEYNYQVTSKNDFVDIEQLDIIPIQTSHGKIYFLNTLEFSKKIDSMTVQKLTVKFINLLFE